MISEFDWTVPTLGKPLKWRPLKAQISLDERAAGKNMHESAVAKSLLLRRIFSYDGHEGQPNGKEFGDWDELDYEEFGREVYEKEEARKAAFRKSKISPADAMANFKAALEEVRRTAFELGQAATLALEVAAAEEAARDPLDSGQK